MIMEFIRKETYNGHELYLMEDLSRGQYLRLSKLQVKNLLKQGDVKVTNLKLSSDDRIIPSKGEVIKYKNGAEVNLQTCLSKQGFICRAPLVSPYVVENYKADVEAPNLASTGIIVAVHKKTNDFAFVGGVKRGKTWQKQVIHKPGDKIEPITGCILTIILDNGICYMNNEATLKQLNDLGTDFIFKRWGE